MTARVETPAEAARRHILRGFQPVAIPTITKGPNTPGWHLLRYAEADFNDLPALFPPDGNIGLNLGAPSGGLVDIDLDCPEAISLGRAYLPLTDMMHGRPSNPNSHYWYIVEPFINLQQFRDPTGNGKKMIVELRSSDGTKGFQTVIPPSMHPDGERIAWVSDGDPRRVDGPELISRVKIIAAGALLARHFPGEGQRHEFALALASVLLRHDTPEEEAYKFVFEVCRAGGSTDPAARAQTVPSTAKKIEEGGSVTGIPRLVEIVGDGVVKRFCEWMEIDSQNDRVREMIERLAAKKLALAAGTSVTVAAGGGDNGEGTGGVGAGAGDGGVGAGASKAEESTGQDENVDWVDTLIKGERGIIACGQNVHLVLSNYSELKGCIRWNDVERRIVLSGMLEKVDPEVVDVWLTDFISENFNFHMNSHEVFRRVMRVALDNRYDPVADYLRSLVWDQTPRVSANGGWLKTYAGARQPEGAPSNYLEVVGRKWLISLVARSFVPGCKADLVLVLEGDQGKYKSSLLRELGGEWYCSASIVLGEKDSKMLAGGKWLVELPELASFRRSELNAIKAFFSTEVDTFRPPYGRATMSFKRRAVFAATSNDGEDYLDDLTGNRRYLCVWMEGADIEAIRRDRDQIWAEAVALYMRHEKCKNQLKCGCWWLVEDEVTFVEDETDKRVADPLYGDVIAAWWHDMAPEKRPTEATLLQIARDALHIETSDRLSKSLQREIASTLKSKRLKWKRTQKRLNGKPTWVWLPPAEWMTNPQSEAGKAKDALKPKTFGVYNGGKK